MSADSAQLPSWNHGSARKAIVDFVARVTEIGGRDFVPTPDRIAVFDNDGTLWCERPVQVPVFFAFARLEELAKRDPSIRNRKPFKAFLEHDIQAITSLGKQAVFEFAFATHAGMTAEEFDASARSWLASAMHPQFGRLFKENVYRPQLELLAYLRRNGFKTFIVTGGGADLIRVVSEDIYGIPRNQVVGSSVKSRFEIRDGRAEIVKLAELDSFDDHEAKPENIYLHIGRRPILAFGNSDGDLPMLRYAKGSRGPSLSLLLHHDDGGREFAYDREFKLSPLTEALDKAGVYDISLVSMKRDWKTVFGEGE